MNARWSKEFSNYNGSRFQDEWEREKKALTTEGNIGPAVEEDGERVLRGVEEGDGKDELRQLPGSRVGHGSLRHVALQQPQERWNPSA